MHAKLKHGANHSQSSNSPIGPEIFFLTISCPTHEFFFFFIYWLTTGVLRTKMLEKTHKMKRLFKQEQPICIFEIHK